MCKCVTFSYECGCKHLNRIGCHRGNFYLCDDTQNKVEIRYYLCPYCLEFEANRTTEDLLSVANKNHGLKSKKEASSSKPRKVLGEIETVHSETEGYALETRSRTPLGFDEDEDGDGEVNDLPSTEATESDSKDKTSVKDDENMSDEIGPDDAIELDDEEEYNDTKMPSDADLDGNDVERLMEEMEV